ncbi:tetratricopeptide repeat protein [Anaerolineales bacterium HSG25]|nr:tetratricopeptide repeat protein [Anaerolineales bacterium HSG25]
MTKLTEYLHRLELLDLITLQQREPEPVYTFKHIFTQESVYSSMLLSDRRALHQQVGEVLEDLYVHTPLTGGSDNQDSNETALLLAHHFEQGGDRTRSIKYLKQAAAKAKASYANQEAKTLYDQLLELTEENDLQTQWDILADREQVADRLGLREQQAQDLEALRQLANLMADNIRLAMSYNRQATQLDKISQYQAANEAAEKGLTYAKRANNERLKAQSLNLLAWSAWRRFDYPQVKVYAEQALNALHVTSDPLNQINSLLHLGKASYRLGQYDIALEYIQAVQELAQLVDNPDSEANAHLILGWIYQRLGYYDKAETEFQAVLEKRQITGDKYGQATALSHLGWVAYDKNEYEKGLELCQQALEMSCMIGDRENEAYSLAGLALNYEGQNQPQLAYEHYYQALQIHQEIGATTLVIFDQTRLAHLALQANNDKTARQNTEAVTAWILDGKAQQFWDPWSIYLSVYQLLSALGEADTARQLLNEAHTLLEQRATQISDEKLRHCFRNRVTVNREIIEAWQIENQS